MICYRGIHKILMKPVTSIVVIFGIHVEFKWTIVQLFHIEHHKSDGAIP